MLLNLQVRDFAIVDRIDVEFGPGMTVLTGETGAGKSILIDALSLVLGERGSASFVRNGAKRAEFSAEFDVSALSHVQEWLSDADLDLDGDCLLRRVISADGRSRGYINGNSVPVSELKRLGEFLLDIHGQHFHQSLTRREVQRSSLDHFGELNAKVQKTAELYDKWKTLNDALGDLQKADGDAASRIDLLEFQLQELKTLQPSEGEFEALQSERSKLLNAGKLADNTRAALDGLSDDESHNANDILAKAAKSVQAIVDVDPELLSLSEQIQHASVQVAEAAESLRHYADNLDMDPARRDWVEERLDALQRTARKHRCDAEALPTVMNELTAELHAINNREQLSADLVRDEKAARDAYAVAARKLSKARQSAAKKYSSAVTDAMSGLGMPGGTFRASVDAPDEQAIARHGMDQVDYLISANPGQELKPLSKVASGGELSRMSLSIQVIASDGSAIPVMIFDEVDSGVGGGVAEMVGRRLQQLSTERQVLCVTHLPQVASLADHHFRVSKVTDGKSTRTGVRELNTDERIDELARMLGGVEITQKTLDHAAEMLAAAPQKSA